MKAKTKYTDNRNWSEYNGDQIRRGYFYFNPEFLDKWNEEVKQISMIKFLAVLHCRFDFKGLEGFMRWLSKINKYNFPIISYSQISRRYSALKIGFKILGGYERLS